MLIIAFFEIIHFLGIFGLGAFYNTLLRRLNFKLSSPIQLYWFGFFLLVLHLHFISLFFSLTQKVYLIYLLSFIGILFNLKKIRFGLPRVSSTMILFFLILISHSYINQDVTLLDSYGYHANMVKWNHDFGVVNGITLLETRFGFNSSFWLLTAFFDNFYLENRSVYFGNIFIFTSVTVTLLPSLTLKRNYVLGLFSLMGIFFLSLRMDLGEINSFSSDFPMQSLVWVSIYFLIRSDKRSHFLFFLLSVVSFSFKISGAFFVGFSFLFLIYKYYKKYLSLILVFSLGFIYILGFVMRNILISGSLIFPVALLNLNLPWSLANSSLVNLTDVINAWARAPGELFYRSLDLTFLEWIVPWAKGQIYNLEFYFSIIIMFFLPFILVFRFEKLFRERITLIILGASISILLMFLKGPDYRFFAVFYWLLMFYLLNSTIQIFSLSYQKLTIILFLLCISILVYQGLPAKIVKNLKESTSSVFFVRTMDSLPVERFQYDCKNGNSFIYYSPTKMECGNSMLPCVSKYTDMSSIDMIACPEISKGFKLKKELN
ncbi:MAG: hypothetical protein O9264_10015 [Leptospira sp.]|nr:hypothetical protein [Leptospira sp.]